ncbi:hypothetical protein JCM16303_003287 [Sporobolomyces ruberrimus]
MSGDFSTIFPHHGGVELPLLKTITPYDLVTMQLRRQEPFSGIEHEGFDLVHDGWSAAIWVSYRGHTFSDLTLRSLLYDRECRTEELVLENCAVSRRSDVREQELQESVSTFWKEVCEKNNDRGILTTEILRKRDYLEPDLRGETVPTVSTSSAPSPGGPSDSARPNATVRPVGRAYRKIQIRTHEPLSYPFPVESHHHLFGFVHEPNDDDYLPGSAIFFASRFHRLRELSHHLSNVSQGGRAPSAHDRQAQTDMYSIIMSMLVYYRGMLVLHTTDTNFSFRYSDWKKTYKVCEEMGSEVFGFTTSFIRNREFLFELGEQGKYEGLFKRACDWWVPEDEHPVTLNKEKLYVALSQMQINLLKIFDDPQVIEDFPHRHLVRYGQSTPYVPVARSLRRSHGNAPPQ